MLVSRKNSLDAPLRKPEPKGSTVFLSSMRGKGVFLDGTAAEKVGFRGRTFWRGLHFRLDFGQNQSARGHLLARAAHDFFKDLAF